MPLPLLPPLPFSRSRCDLLRAVLLGLWLAILATPLAAVAFPTLPRLAITQGSPEVARETQEIERMDPALFRPGLELTGLDDAGPPIAVLVAPENSAAARAVPSWVSGYADGAASAVVLLPQRVGRYPYGSLEALVEHEVAHVLIARAAGDRPVPRWFDEGMAMAASRGQDLEDQARVALAVLMDGRVTLQDLDASFHGSRPDVQVAYALAGDFVADLLRRHGSTAGAGILAQIARGASFENAFATEIREPLAAVEASYWKRRTFWNRWVPILSSTATLWTGVTLLALVAFRRRSARDAALRASWEAEEQAEALARAAREEEEDGDAGDLDDIEGGGSPDEELVN